MQKINPELLQAISNNLMLELTQDEYKILAEEFYIILEQMKLVQTIDTTNYEAMHFPFKNSHHQLRTDDVSYINDHEAVLKNAWAVEDDYIVISKVIE